MTTARSACRTLPTAPPTSSDLARVMMEALPRGELLHFGFARGAHPLPVQFRPLVPDDRCATGSLFGFDAPTEWDVTGVVLTGIGRCIDDRSTVRGTVTSAVVVDRAGQVAEHVESEQPLRRRDAATPPRLHPLERSRSGPHGLAVDTLLRTFGLPAAGEAPPAEHLGITMWTMAVAAALCEGPVTWRRIVEVHPASPMHPGAHFVPVATMLARTLGEYSAALSWERIHTRASTGESLPLDLGAREAAWMDSTMYARWVLTSMPSPCAVLDAVSQSDELTGRRFREVLDLVVASAVAAGSQVN